MRLRILLRAAVVAALVAAAADLRWTSAGGPRTRIYVVDASGSVRARGADESLTLQDALRLVSWDSARSAPEDRSALIFAAAKPVPAIPPAARDDFRPAEAPVDPVGTDLEGALEAAVALADEGDVILLSDGRAAATQAPLLARSRGVPVHVMPIGPLSPRDVRIAGVDLPASVAPGSSYAARISLESTSAIAGVLKIGSGHRSFRFEGPGRLDFVVEGLRGTVPVRIDADDHCPENDSVTLEVLERSAAPRTLLLAATSLGIPGDLGWHDPARYDVILVDNVPLTGDQMARIASAVRAGAGLVLLGGPRAHALGGWAGTPIEELSPLWAFPDERGAVVACMDVSGSMGEAIPSTGERRIDAAASALASALALLRDDDELAAVAFSGAASVLSPLVPGKIRGSVAESLRRASPTGETRLAAPLVKAVELLEGATAARKRVLLVTDGDTRETLDELRAAGAMLADRRIGLIVVATAGPRESLALLGGTVLPASDPASLVRVVGEAMARSQELLIAPRAASGLPLPALMNRTTAKPGSEILARADEAPLLALGRAGRGRVAAAAFSFDAAWIGAIATWGGLADLVQKVAPEGMAGTSVTAEIDGDSLVVSATLPGTADLPDSIEIAVGSRTVSLQRRGARRYEGRLPAAPGTQVVRLAGRPAAAAVLPCPAEYASIGVDRPALESIAERAGGRLLKRIEDWPPRRERGSPRSARPFLLTAAILLFLADAGLGLIRR